MPSLLTTRTSHALENSGNDQARSIIHCYVFPSRFDVRKIQHLTQSICTNVPYTILIFIEPVFTNVK